MMKSSQAGFSLLELLIYIAILSVLSLALINVFISVNRGRGQIQARSSVNSVIRFATDKMSQDIRSATSVSVPSTTASASSSLEMTISGVSVQYCVTSGVLRRQSGAVCTGASEAMTPATVVVSTPLFTRYENANIALSKTITSIEIDLSAAYNSTSPDFQYSENKKTSITLRQ
jgi:prepilin-type N-terminal cleavage/methylation domain-containing protein